MKLLLIIFKLSKVKIWKNPGLLGGYLRYMLYETFRNKIDFQLLCVNKKRGKYSGKRKPETDHDKPKMEPYTLKKSNLF